MGSKNNLPALKPSYWAMVSGGKDSLFMLNIILNNLNLYPLDGVAHYDMETDYPFINDVVGEMERRCKSVGIPFFRFKPTRTWMEYYEMYGYPNGLKRWCNHSYKLSCQTALRAMLREQGKYLVAYIGFCADEEKRFKVDLFDRSQSVRFIYPLAEMGINEYEIWLWAREQPLFNDYYKYNRRVGCMGCPLSSLREFAYMATYYPEQYNMFMDLAQKSEDDSIKMYGRYINPWDWKVKYNTAYRREIIPKKYLPIKEIPIDKPFRRSKKEKQDGKEN